ncbi:MAG: 3-deoxy-manno-octulosonate cytidylyltransferase [Acidobacteriota bacterium]|nr:3-deoxy-manno-octulosonate cytidylyltransferase [Blastocatellia bacterium]MDW8240776.1 3-deoxy-manno-octulosonate cytidylyltransferase [Acidobacteriota bacterium]
MKTASVVAIIPARYGSQRLPGKALADIAGRPMIVHVMERVRQARRIRRVIVATDDERIVEAVERYGGEAAMTSPHHASGTDRVAEVAASLNAQIIVNVQGDEPLIEPATIEAALGPMLRDESIEICTTSEPITSVDDVFDPNVVKVVTDRRGFALYFSRNPLPYLRRGDAMQSVLHQQPEWLAFYRKHTGLYVYRRDCLLRLTQLEQSLLEQLERLEQLRALEHGIRIKVVPVRQQSIGVDTAADLQRVRDLLREAQANG